MKSLLWVLTILFLNVLSPLSAEPLRAPDGRVLLTVSGDITQTNGPDGAVFDRAMLESLEWRELRTFTSFTEGEQVFEGPTLASLLEVLGVASGTLHATAINDYTVEINAADAFEHDVLLAMTHNGQKMRVRDKGPIWVVYPMSRGDAARNLYDAEMIWQLVRIRVE